MRCGRWWWWWQWRCRASHSRNICLTWTLPLFHICISIHILLMLSIITDFTLSSLALLKFIQFWRIAALNISIFSSISTILISVSKLCCFPAQKCFFGAISIKCVVLPQNWFVRFIFYQISFSTHKHHKTSNSKHIIYFHVYFRLFSWRSSSRRKRRTTHEKSPSVVTSMFLLSLNKLIQSHVKRILLFIIIITW